MKRAKKLLALILTLTVALTMGVSICVTAFAAGETDGSVTVTNTHQGQTYTLYKLFDAQYNTTTGAVTYTLPAGKTLGDGEAWFEITDNGFVVAKEGVSTDWAKDPDAIAWAQSFGRQVGEAKTAASDGAEVKWTDLSYGYYFVDSTLGAFIGVDSTLKNATIEDKNNPPTVDKVIVEVTHGVVGTDSEKVAETDQGANEAAIAQIGDTVSYKLTIVAKPGAQNYVVTDTLDEGLTPPTAVTVKAGDATLTPSGEGTDGDYTFNANGQTITVTFSQTYLSGLFDVENPPESVTITIEYNATLNGNAVIGEDGNANSVKLTWGNDHPEVNYMEDDATIYTAKVDLIKYDDKETALKGAGFVLKNADGKYYALANGVVTWVDAIGDADEHTSGTDGKIGYFTGLTAGTYTLVEKTLPEGYTQGQDVTVTIANNDYTNDNLIQIKEATNTTGMPLPTTGGIGTTIFYILGALLVIICGIVLIARRRMAAK